jgi:thiamine biosynthesis lipoprotein
MVYILAMKILSLLSFLFIFLSCSSPSKPINFEGETMGTYYRIKTFGTESPEDLKVEVDKFLRLYNNIFSTYIPDSEVSRINNSKFKHNKISESLLKVLELSSQISKKSYGYFDITVAPLVNSWGFGPTGKQKKPTEKEIEILLKRVGHTKVSVKENRFHKPLDMKIDLSAVAKGFGVDELVKFLEYRGYKDLLVEIGGESRTRGRKADGSYWSIGIEGPSEKLGSKIVKIIPLNNMSMATSGSYRNYLKYGDKVFSHTINPITGQPVTHTTISVTIISEYCADADAWATGLMSMGYEKGLDLASKYNLLVYFQIKEGSKISTLSSKSLERYLKKLK